MPCPFSAPSQERSLQNTSFLPKQHTYYHYLLTGSLLLLLTNSFPYYLPARHLLH